MFEGKPKNLSPEEIEKAEENRKQVERLKKEGEAIHDSSVYDLASWEDSERERLESSQKEENKFVRGLRKMAGMGEFSSREKDKINQEANLQSSRELERMELEEALTIDSLTKLKNRKALEEDVPKSLAGERREGRDCSILMIDLDDFKSVNSEYGFLAGNEVLKAIAAIINRNIRHSDFAYRVGGEEIAVFLPNQDAQKAAEVAERIRAAVEREVIKVTDNKGAEHDLKKTLSIGVVDSKQILEWSQISKEAIEENILKQMLKKSDSALRAAKSAGKNQAVIYDPAMDPKDQKNI